jgi:hypothetical protein
MTNKTNPWGIPSESKMKYQVNHPHTSGGPKFSSLSAALNYIRHAMQNGNDFMTISKL